MNIFRSGWGWCVIASVLAACTSGGGTTSSSSAGGAGGGGATSKTSGGGGVAFTGPVVGSGGGCGHVPPPATPTCDDLDAGPTPTFAHDIAPMFSGRCSGEICHGTPTYDWLVGVPTLECCDHRDIVDPGDPAKSYLVTKLSGKDLCTGSQMPLVGKPLDAASQARIVAWICGGALR